MTSYLHPIGPSPFLPIKPLPDPPSHLLIREVKICIPNAQAINRGNHRVDELIEACKKADFTDIIVLNETRGQPDALSIRCVPKE